MLRARHTGPGSEGTGYERAHPPPAGIPGLCGEDVEGAGDGAILCGRIMDRPGDRASGGIRRHFGPIRAQMGRLLADEPPVHKGSLARVDGGAVDRHIEVAPLEPDAAPGHVGDIDRHRGVIVGARVIGTQHQICRCGRTCEHLIHIYQKKPFKSLEVTGPMVISAPLASSWASPKDLVKAVQPLNMPSMPLEITFSASVVPREGPPVLRPVMSRVARDASPSNMKRMDEICLGSQAGS